MAKPGSNLATGELDAIMVSMHEVYMSAIRAGFNPAQSMDLVKEMLTAGMVEGLRGTQEDQG